MRSLILKIFLCYWLAASCVLVATDLGPHQQIHRPQAAAALASAMRVEANHMSQAYETGGCPAMRALVSQGKDRIYLATPSGQVLCDASPVSSLAPLVQEAARSKAPFANNYHNFQLVALATSGYHGHPYLVLIKSQYTLPLEAFGFVVGPTTIWISIGVTILLGVFIALPIRRLRTAARLVAQGRLDTRVHLGWLYDWFPRLQREDVLTGLAHDFNNMADRLEILADSQRTLFRDISHELRSPLARLSVALELARQASPTSMLAPLDRIENEAARVNELIGQMLTLSHMETTQELNQPTELSLRDLIECLLPDLEYEAAGRQRSIRTRQLDDCIVHGDLVLLQRAVENVVRNAICHTPEHGGVEIELRRTNRDGIVVGVLEITDDGPGVPDHELQTILLPFYRADKARQPTTGGFGVGLAIANRAVKLHSGQIAISNKPAGGLVVQMSFPLIECPVPNLMHQ